MCEEMVHKTWQLSTGIGQSLDPYLDIVLVFGWKRVCLG